MIEKRNPKEDAEHAGIACSGAVLAGGESRRFGQDKAHAILAGKPLVTHVVETLQALFEDVLIVTNEPVSYEHFDVTVVSDIVRGAGSLGGLLTARPDHVRVITTVRRAIRISRPRWTRSAPMTTSDTPKSGSRMTC